MKRSGWDALMSRYPALFALILFVLSIIINFFLTEHVCKGNAEQ